MEGPSTEICKADPGACAHVKSGVALPITLSQPLAPGNHTPILDCVHSLPREHVGDFDSGETAQGPGFSDPVEMNQGLGSLWNPDQYVGALDQIHNWDMVASWNWTSCLKKRSRS